MSKRKSHTLTRRKFLIVSALGITGLVMANVLPAFGKEYPEPKSKLTLFSAKEFYILTAIAAQFISFKGDVDIAPEDIAFRADQLISGANRDVQTKFRQMLALFELGTFIFGFHFARFTKLSSAAQEDYLKSWAYSRFTFRRSVFQALKRLCLNIFFTNEKSWGLINYGGPLL